MTIPHSSPWLDDASATAVPPAQPLVFDGLAGFYHAATGEIAVLLLSPWGYEELCSRKTYRVLGETLASLGYPCLRFDYPGTGHSCGDSTELADDDAWHGAVRRALAELRALCDPRAIVVMGQGIGGALAGDLAREVELAGLVLLAPVARGRGYLRELAAWTAMTKPTFLVDASDGPQGGLMAGGFVLSPASVGEVRALDLVKGAVPRADKVLLVERPGHSGDARLAQMLEGAGVDTTRVSFDGYADYVSDPTMSRVPVNAVEAVASWMIARFPTSAQRVPASRLDASSASFEAPDYSQTLARFGPAGMFFGALTQPPQAEIAGKTVFVFLNSGYDHSVGWARTTVDLGRNLARGGLASLRMDLAGIGESRRWPGQGEQVLYSMRQVDDVKAALDWLIDDHGAERVVLVGRCSGAYVALVAGAADPRVAGVVLVNARRFVWDPHEDVDTALRAPIQTLDTYRRKMVDRQVLKRVLSGDLSLTRSAGRALRALRLVADRKLAWLLRGLSRHYRLARVVQRRFAALHARDMALLLIYSEGDPGLQEMTTWFGEAYGGLKRFPNAELAFIGDADHNLTPLAARAALLDKLRVYAARIAG